jgi:glyoxylase-like metal-dependent hydrolase (beta-lactamase superfamily II)
MQIEHAVDWATYAGTGETWRGLPAVRSLPGLPAEILAIPMPGHTRGHACIAVEAGGRWLVHAGDAYFHHGALTGSHTPAGGRLFERVAAIDYARVLDNHVRLGELAREGGSELDVFCAHDPTEFDRLRGKGA